MVFGMATGSIMISGKDDHYFDESNERGGSNKSRYCEFFVMDGAIYGGWELVLKVENIGSRFTI